LRNVDLQLHQNAFGGPTGELAALPQTPSWILWVGTGKGGDEKGGGEGREGKGGGEGQERKGGKVNGRRRDGTTPNKKLVMGLKSDRQTDRQADRMATRALHAAATC